MLRVNVASHPFYNERGVHLLFGSLGLLLAALTALNVWALFSLSDREAQLTRNTAQQEAKARDLKRDATRLRASLRQEELQAVVTAAQEANGLIDRRVFSWTALFNYLEATLPDDVMLTAIRPTVDAGRVEVTLVVIGREVDAIDAFMERLEGTQAFSEVLSRDEQSREDGSYQATLVARYTPEHAQPPTPATRVAQPHDEDGTGNESVAEGGGTEDR